MAEYRVKRTGELPLVFQGQRLCEEVSTREESGPGQNRYHLITVFKTGGGKFVASVRFESNYRDEGPLFWARLGDSLKEVLDALIAFDCVPDGVACPSESGPFEAKAVRARRSMQSRYSAALSEVFERIGKHAAEEIE